MVRRWREWLFGQIRDVWQRVYPQTVWAFKHPRPLTFAVGAVLLQTGSYVAAFVFSLMAFGQDVSVLKVAAVIFRLATFYAEIPLGWVAFEYMERKRMI